MKKKLVLILTVLLLLALNSCEKSVHYAGELLELNISPAIGTVSLRIDSREGLKKEGTLKTIIRFPSDIEALITQDSRWQSYPPDASEQEKLKKHFKDLWKTIPQISDGYYLLVDHMAADGKTIYTREKNHFIFAVYSPMARQIYYYELNE